MLALCDLDEGIDHAALPFEVLNLGALRDIRVWGMAERYNATEFCTAIKPLIFQVLFDRHPGAAIVYFDPDIWVMSRLTELEQSLAAGAQVVLTPHMTTPSSRPDVAPDQSMLQYGVYNLGFVAMREGPDARRLVAWWAHRLEFDCRIDIPAGLFVDQKWADLIPALIDRVAVLRHPGYNVAYWNVLDRSVWCSPAGWVVNEQPLRFVHFSGHDLTRPEVFSRHVRYLDNWSVGDLFLLQSVWRNAVLGYDYQAFGALHYGFRFAEDGAVNAHTPSELADQIAAGMTTIGHDAPAWDTLFHRSFGSWAEWEAQRDGLQAEFAQHRATERALLPAGNTGFTVPGRCGMCRTDAAFGTSFQYAVHIDTDGRSLPNWREHLDCRCGFNDRMRGAVQALQALIDPAPGAAIYLTEQVTRLYGWLRMRWPGVVGSEYLGATHVPGHTYNGVRHEDLCRLSFADAQFDVVLSLDVLEHVADLGAALAECWRVLKPGGTLLFAAPTQFGTPAVIDRVVVGPDGTLTFLAPPEYHGNPVDAEHGSLCFRYFGLAVLDQLRALGFTQARCVMYWSRDLGLLGPEQNVFVAVKPMTAKRSSKMASAPRKSRRVALASGVKLDPALQKPALPDEWAYGTHDPGMPTLQAYHVDPDIALVMERLALHGTLALVDRFRMLILLRLLRSTAAVEGEVWELGVYRGGSALLIRNELAGAGGRLRLFDTFAGMPETDPARDFHVAGDFADTSLAEVQALVGTDAFIDWRPGLIPITLRGLEPVRLRFVHIDLDIYAPIVATLGFAWPRLTPGAIMLFDDYGFRSCPGARAAVDEFCLAQGVALVPLPTGQAFVIKSAQKRSTL